MKTKYIATDLELYSKENLDIIIKEFGDDYVTHLNQLFNEKYSVALGEVMNRADLKSSLKKYCDLIENLSETAKKKWKSCKKTLDIGFEGGTCHPSTFLIPLKLTKRLAELDVEIAITIYPVENASR